MSNKRVLILGGGFAGVYTAMRLERLLRQRADIEVVLVSRENYMVFQPMLAEVISGNLGVLDSVAPIARLIPKTKLYVRDVQSVDVANKSVTLSPGFGPQPTVLQYDHLVVALGNVTDFRKVPGLHDHALPFKNLGDALRLRDHLLHVLREAAVESDPDLRRQLLTFVIAGGGFSGVEVCAELNDFVRDAGPKVFGLRDEDIRVVLVHSHERILDREMPESLALYAQSIIGQRGVEFIFDRRLQTATPEFAVLDDEQRITTRTLISTVPSSPNPIVLDIDAPKERGRILVDLRMQVAGTNDLWSLGDCALIPSPTGSGFCPPTAQFATRQAATCAHNIMATIDGGQQEEFAFSELGKMASLGRRRAIARLFNRFNLHGVMAWAVWRATYWSKLPGIDRKIKVGASWALELFCGPELVQTKLDVPRGMREEHFEPGEIVVHQGDPMDWLFIVTAGRVEILTNEAQSDGSENVQLTVGQCFGALSLLNDETCPADIRCLEPLTVVAYPKRELQPLLEVREIRDGFQQAQACNQID